MLKLKGWKNWLYGGKGDGWMELGSGFIGLGLTSA